MSCFAGQGSPLKVISVAPAPLNNAELKDDVIKYYRDSGLEPIAKEVGIQATLNKKCLFPVHRVREK